LPFDIDVHAHRWREHALEDDAGSQQG
jgi:hypothetical protein